MAQDIVEEYRKSSDIAEEYLNVLKAQILNKGLSDNGGWSNKQLRALGLPDSYFKANGGLVKGWKDYLIGSNINEKNINEFLSLKNKHLKLKKQQKFSFQ